jgi:hypothetical protein
MAEPTVFRPGGVSYVRIPAPDPNRAAALFRDPAGNEIGIWQQGS